MNITKHMTTLAGHVLAGALLAAALPLSGCQSAASTEPAIAQPPLTATGADYAEYMEKRVTYETIREGDIVGVYDGFVTRATDGADTLMVVSSAPALIGNRPDDSEIDRFVPVAFAGIVPIVVAGSANPGDFVIPSGLQNGIGQAIPPEEITAEQLHDVVGVVWDIDPRRGLHQVICTVGVNESRAAAVIIERLFAETPTE